MANSQKKLIEANFDPDISRFLYRYYYELDKPNNLLDKFKSEKLTIEDVDDEMKNDFYVAMHSIEQNIHNMEFVSDKLKSDEIFAEAAIAIDAYAANYVRSCLIDNVNFVLRVIKRNVYIYEYLSYELKSDHEVILSAVKSDIDIIHYIDESMLSDKELLAKILSVVPGAYKYLPVARQDRDLSLIAMAKGMNLQYVADELKSDVDIAVAAIVNTEFAFMFVGNDMRRNKHFFTRLIEIDRMFVNRFNKDEFESMLEVLPDAVETFADKIANLVNELQALSGK